MPEHVHLLFSEPERGDPSVVMKVLKQSFARRLLAKLRGAAALRPPSVADTPLIRGHVWQRRFYDFVVFTDKKRVEKLRYMHRNPVVRGLVLAGAVELEQLPPSRPRRARASAGERSAESRSARPSGRMIELGAKPSGFVVRTSRTPLRVGQPHLW